MQKAAHIDGSAAVLLAFDPRLKRWRKYARTTRMAVQSDAQTAQLTIRDDNSGVVVATIDRTSRVTVDREKLLVFVEGMPTSFALQLEKADAMSVLLGTCKELGVQFVGDKSVSVEAFPDLARPEVQAFISEVLQTSQFMQFVDQLETMLTERGYVL